MFFQKQNNKKKVKVEIKTEIKPPKKEKIKAPKRKRKNEINIDEKVKKNKETKKTIKKTFRRSNSWKRKKKKRKKIDKTRKKAIKGLVDFNNFIRDEVVEPGQKRSSSLAAHNVKQEIINSYRWWKEEGNKLIQCISLNESKGNFYATDKITKTLIKNQETHYIKKTLFL